MFFEKHNIYFFFAQIHELAMNHSESISIGDWLEKILWQILNHIFLSRVQLNSMLLNCCLNVLFLFIWKQLLIVRCPCVCSRKLKNKYLDKCRDKCISIVHYIMHWKTFIRLNWLENIRSTNHILRNMFVELTFQIDIYHTINPVVGSNSKSFISLFWNE